MAYYCRYGCGKKLEWHQGNMPFEVDTAVPFTIEHTYKRCADIQIAQGRKPYFFDKAPKKGHDAIDTDDLQEMGLST